MVIWINKHFLGFPRDVTGICLQPSYCCILEEDNVEGYLANSFSSFLTTEWRKWGSSSKQPKYSPSNFDKSDRFAKKASNNFQTIWSRTCSSRMSSAPRSISVLMIEDALMSSFSSSLNPDWAASFSTKEGGSRSMARDKCLNRIWGLLSGSKWQKCEWKKCLH